MNEKIVLRKVKKLPKLSNRTTYLANNSRQKNQVALWSLQILLDLRGWKKLQREFYGITSNIDILTAVGLERLEDKEIGKKKFVKILKKQRENFALRPMGINADLDSNTKQLALNLGLNEVERKILLFAVILQEDKGLQETADLLGELSTEDVAVVLSTILDISRQETYEALSRHGLLAKSGLLKLDRDIQNELSNKLDMLDGLAEALKEPGITVETILECFFKLAGEPELAERNYRHAADHFSLIKEHLQSACRRRTKGVNILVYGPPGTGKTEFAKTITQILGCMLYEINIGRNNLAFNKSKRLVIFKLAQHVLARQNNALILFDEIDDVLGENFGIFLRDDDSLNHKAWINKYLENNPVPAIWIANDIGSAESSFIRRFDIVFHLDTPPRSTRLEILGNYLHDIPVRKQWLERLADNKHIAPGVIATAARVIRQQQNPQDPETIENKIEQLLESTLTAMGYPREPVIKTRSQLVYRLGAVNPDQDLEKIVKGLQSQGEGRLCLYGPPGTGKTEFGHYLARQLDKPLLVKRSSDLLGPYVGETEANIAAMFHEATYENAVLLLDEADSFLRDRNEARRSWEVTQVNELLTQMERYNGVFVCSTNLMESLDAASLRRFDLKIKFDFLKVKQAWDLFSSIFSEKGVKLPRKKFWQGELAKYPSLTPGDFATVVRKNRISGVKLCPESLLEGLAGEMTFKQTPSTRRIGFLTTKEAVSWM